MDIILNIIVSAITGFAAFAVTAATKLGERLLSHHLDAKLADLRHDQNQQIEQLKAQLGHLADRGVRANEREFSAIAAVWERFVDAYVGTLQCVMAFIQHPDFFTMSDDAAASYLDSKGMSESLKTYVLTSPDRNKAYSRTVIMQHINNAGELIFDARSLLRKQSIFIPDELKRAFENALSILSGAQVQRSMEQESYGKHVELKGVSTLIESQDSIFNDLLTAVRKRMLRE